ncbi:MAG: ArsR family transcriptional regulator [Chloroflexia bacterium]
MASTFGKRFFGSTRGQIVLLLRYGSRTIEELAEALGITDNGIRAQLATLERDGLVEQKGTRSGPGKPAFLYELAPDAEELFAKPYAQVLIGLLDVLDDELGTARSETIMREVGRRLSRGQRLLEEPLSVRVESAVAVLNKMGGLAELREEDGKLFIHGYSCPLLAAVPRHPQVCKLTETMLTNLVGAPVYEQCDRAEPWHCHFELPGEAKSSDHAIVQ